MAFRAIHNQNPFILPSVLLGLLLLLRAIFIHRPGRLRSVFLKLGRSAHHAIIIAFLTCLTLVPVFESYYTVYECSVSTRYHQETLEAVRRTIAALSSAGVAYWLDYATLLAALRRQSINPWDHDADLSILHPDYSKDSPRQWTDITAEAAITASSPAQLKPSAALSSLLSHLDAHQLHPSYEAERQLIQTRLSPSAQPHIDVWLWTPTVVPPAVSPLPASPPPSSPSSSFLRLHTADLTVHYNDRRWDDVFPLVNVSWLSVPGGALIPHDAHRISSLEFGVYGGSYLIASVFRGDCFHNFFYLRFLYGFMA